MSDETTRPVARIESHSVQAIHTAVPSSHERPRDSPPDSPPPDPDAEPVELPSWRTTDLAYQVDAESKHISVQVVDRETGSVVRSFPLVLPGHDGSSENPEAETPRGALIDAKV
jgi:hypothetical protein